MFGQYRRSCISALRKFAVVEVAGANGCFFDLFAGITEPDFRELVDAERNDLDSLSGQV